MTHLATTLPAIERQNRCPICRSVFQSLLAFEVRKKKKKKKKKRTKGKVNIKHDRPMRQSGRVLAAGEIAVALIPVALTSHPPPPIPIPPFCSVGRSGMRTIPRTTADRQRATRARPARVVGAGRRRRGRPSRESSARPGSRFTCENKFLIWRGEGGWWVDGDTPPATSLS